MPTAAPVSAGRRPTRPCDSPVMAKTRVESLVAAIEDDLPKPWTVWPGGWPNEVEAALIDAVLSIRACYGGPQSGVRGAVRRYRQALGEGATLDSLDRLAAYAPKDLEDVLGVRQKTSGVTKAQAIVNAAQSLMEAGVRHSSDVEPEAHKRAYTRVHGLGSVTWEYFTMLIGHRDQGRYLDHALGVDRRRTIRGSPTLPRRGS